MTPESAIEAAGIVTTAALSFYANYRSDQKRAVDAAARLDTQAAVLENKVAEIKSTLDTKIEEVKRSIPAQQVFDVSAMSVGQFRNLSAFLTEQLNGRYMPAVEVKEGFRKIEQKIENGHEKLREDVRHDVRAMLSPVALALSHHDPEVAKELERDLRKTNPPD